MDKVFLSTADIENLFRWRDSHKEEVRSNPAPVHSIELVCKDSHILLKCVREEEIVKMWVNVECMSAINYYNTTWFKESI